MKQICLPALVLDLDLNRKKSTPQTFFGEEGQGSGARDRPPHRPVPSKADFAPTRGRTGFDGGVEVGIAGGCA